MKIKHKLTGFIVAFTLSITALFYLIGIWNQNKYLREETRTHIQNIEAAFHNLEAGDTKKLFSALEVIVQDPGLKAVYLEKNRDRLYSYNQKLFQNLKDSSGITHFYFILPDGHVFLRMHDKKLYGDQVERTSFETAKTTQKPAWGIELGKTAFALRAVMPYFEDGQLIGYVELGEEIDHFLKMLRGKTNNEFGIIAEKDYLNRDDWRRSVRQTSGLRDNWDDLKKHLILGSTDKGEIASKCFVEDNIEGVEKGENIFSEIRHKDRIYLCGGLELKDKAKRHVGAVMTAIDITGHIIFSKRVKNQILVLAIILLLVNVSVGVIISRSITGPIIKLSGLAEAVGKGDLSQRAVVSGTDEVGQLGRTFNDMVERRQRNEEELVWHRDHLEELVRERTVELSNSDARFRALFSSGADAVFVHGMTEDGKPTPFVEANDVACKRLGYSREELLRMTPLDIDAPEALANIGDAAAQMKAEGRAVFEMVHVRRDGTRIPVEISSAIFILSGVPMVVSIARDITDRKNADAALRKAKETAETANRELKKLFNAIEQSEESIVITDINGSIQYVNPFFCKMTGYSKEEANGKNPRILKSGLVLPEVYDDLWKTILSGGTWRGTLINKKKSGDLYYEDATIAPVFDEQGNITNFIAVKTDVTERIRHEEELALKNRELEEARNSAESANRAKSDFLANMSHELRTPLNAILGFSEVLELGIAGPLTDGQKEHIRDIHESGQHLLSLINDILDISKVEAGKMELNLSEVKAGDLISSSLLMFREKAMKHNIKIEAEINEESGEITADERKIKQVLFNLLSNAFKFTPDGGFVRVTTRMDNDNLEISVEDTGIGISEEDQKKLFQPFHQIDSGYQKKAQGTGLGLHLCKIFVELHGGRIWIESEVGKGSRFVFIIPAGGMKERQTTA